MDDQALRALYEDLRQELIRLHANWEIFKQLFAHSDERMGVLRSTAPGYFRLTQDILVDNAVMSLSRLTDPARYNSLAGLLKLLKNHVNHEFYSELEKEIAAIDAMCADIRVHRNQRVAHSVRTGSTPKIVEGVDKLPPITRQHIEGAMIRMAAFMNRVIGYFESVEHIFVPVMMGTADDLVHYLEAGVRSAQNLPDYE